MGAGPESGDIYLRFDGLGSYVEIPSSADFSVETTGELTVSAWFRPDVLQFPNDEGSGYVYWMGKGQAHEQEWAFRMYSRHNTEDPPRPNRISFYVFNPEGGLGVGSYVDDKVSQHQWIHAAGVVGPSQTSIYKDGTYRRCDTYRGPAIGHCPIHTDRSGQQLVINPQAGSAPLRIGTREFASFFEGGIRDVRIWNRALDKTEIQQLFAQDDVPQTGLVAEYRFDEKTGDTAVDSANGHDGTIFGATWAKQR